MGTFRLGVKRPVEAKKDQEVFFCLDWSYTDSFSTTQSHLERAREGHGRSEQSRAYSQRDRRRAPRRPYGDRDLGGPKPTGQQHGAMGRPEKPLAVLGHELEAIVQELEATTAADCDKMDQDEVRQKMRAMKNRLSAKMSRQRALIYVRGLEKSFSDLMARHQALARDFDVVNFERERLHYENATLRQQMVYCSQTPTPHGQNQEDCRWTKHGTWCGQIDLAQHQDYAQAIVHGSGFDAGGEGANTGPCPRAMRGRQQGPSRRDSTLASSISAPPSDTPQQPAYHGHKSYRMPMSSMQMSTVMPAMPAMAIQAPMTDAGAYHDEADLHLWTSVLPGAYDSYDEQASQLNQAEGQAPNSDRQKEEEEEKESSVKANAMNEADSPDTMLMSSRWWPCCGPANLPLFNSECSGSQHGEHLSVY